MDKLFELAAQFQTEITVIAAVLSIFALITAFINALRTSKIIHRYRRLMRGADNKNLEAMLCSHVESVQDALARVDALENNDLVQSKLIKGCIQKAGIIRFNAFEQMGGDQSFSIALLDANGDGVVITGLYGRSSSSTFAKPIRGLKSSYPLSTEELEAISIASSK